jgi:triosephosphate isomerase
MRKVILAGNWKMHELIEDGIALAKCTEQGVKDLPIDVIVFPPFTAIHPVFNVLGSDSKVRVGAQNMHYEEKGAFTGEISPLMLKDAGAEYVILGHSERRNIFGENDELINKKVKSALSHGLKIVLCVGEKLEERENGKTEEVIKNELVSDLKGVAKEDLENIIIAYEPIWAIGTGVSAKPEQAEEVHKYIRSLLDEMFGAGSGSNMTVLYGGSVKPKNIESLAKMPDIDGGLVGGASLKCEDFVEIGRILTKVKEL